MLHYLGLPRLLCHMKIVYLSGGDIHTAKWVNSLSDLGHEVHLVVMEPVLEAFAVDVKIHILPFNRPLGAFLNLFSIRFLLHHLNPDIFHVHGASANGLLGRLSGFHPSILSTLGSDVLLFPNKSQIHKRIVVKNLLFYDWVCSTSKIMAEHISTLFGPSRNLTVIPFGIDTRHFSPGIARAKVSDNITIGTVKAVRPIYGTDILVRAFHKARQMLMERSPALADRMRLLIVGPGSYKPKIRSLVAELHVQNYVEMVDWVSNSQVPDFLRKIDIYVAMSRSESFGVAVLEASACGVPVVVSNVGGLPEVVQDGVTGFIVGKEDVSACADALISLVQDKNLRERMGAAGRKFVQDNYEWNTCMSLMREVHKNVISRGKTSAP